MPRSQVLEQAEGKCLETKSWNRWKANVVKPSLSSSGRQVPRSQVLERAEGKCLEAKF